MSLSDLSAATGISASRLSRIEGGDRRLIVEPGQTAQFATSEPHSMGGAGGPAEVLSRFEPGAHRA